MKWGGVLVAVGLIVGALAIRHASFEESPSSVLAAKHAEDCAAQGTCFGRLVAAAAGGCDDFNECTANDVWQGTTCAGAPFADGTGCASGCGLCWDGECVSNPEREGSPCADGFGAQTVEDVCHSLSGIAVCVGEFVALDGLGDGCDGVAGCADLLGAEALGLDL